MADETDYYHEYDHKITSYHKNDHLSELNTLMDGSELNFRQARYWQKILQDYVMKGIALPYPRQKEWEQAIQCPTKWRPDLKYFIQRVKTAARAYGNNERPQAPEEMTVIDKDNSAPAMKCMRKYCLDDRNYPWVNRIRWWEPNKNDEIFPLMWPKIAPLLKESYLYFEWEKRIHHYGVLLCWGHYQEIYRLCFPHFNGIYPHEKEYFRKEEFCKK